MEHCQYSVCGLNAFPVFQSAAATAATLALPAGVTPVQQILTNSGNCLNIENKL